MHHNVKYETFKSVYTTTYSYKPHYYHQFSLSLSFSHHDARWPIGDTVLMRSVVANLVRVNTHCSPFNFNWSKM